VASRPLLGRWFTSETEPVAVISHAVWQNRFGGSSEHLGARSDQRPSPTRSWASPASLHRHLRSVSHRYLGADADQTQTRGDASTSVAPDCHGLRPPACRGTRGQASAELNSIDAQLVAEHGPHAEPLPSNCGGTDSVGSQIQAAGASSACGRRCS
jgi:hypothetical protein